MSEIFTLSNEIQLATFILEILGVTLAFIEIRFPYKADRIERRIRRSEDWVRNLGEKITNNRLTEWTMTAFIIVFFLSMSDWWGLWELPTAVWIVFSVIYFVVGTIFGLYIIEEVIKILNHQSNGRALGALGVILAILGLAGEIVQMYLNFTSG